MSGRAEPDVTVERPTEDEMVLIRKAISGMFPGTDRGHLDATDMAWKLGQLFAKNGYMLIEDRPVTMAELRQMIEDVPSVKEQWDRVQAERIAARDGRAGHQLAWQQRKDARE